MEPSIRTISIIEPPVRNGGIASSSSRRPYSTPTPDGPSILCPENTAKSTSSSPKCTGMCGTDWQASSSVSAPTAFARATSSATGSTVPSTLDWCANATIFVRSVSSIESRSTRPSSVTEYQRSVAPVRRHSSCHGTRLAWCSSSVTTISSPGPSTNRSAAPPNAAALENA